MKKFYDEAVSKINTLNDKLNAFNLITDYIEPKNTNSKLFGIPYALKDNFSTKGIRTTACSDTLKDYVPVFSATIYDKLLDAGAVLVGKTNMDELAMGGTGTTGNTGVVHNPYDLDRIAGGSSAGSAACVASNIVKFAIGSDTGDSIRKPAAYCGVVGFKPSYGLISRFGLFAFASSMDHVGVFTQNVLDAALVCDVIKGYDSKDMTSIKDMDDVSLCNVENKNFKLFYLKDVCNPDNYDDEETKNILKSFHENLDNYRNNGFDITGIDFDFDLLKAIKPVYDSISCAEASSNNSNLTGVLFGPRSKCDNVMESMKDYRTKGFSSLIKRRFVIGSFVLQKENQEKYFKNAMRVRRLLVEKFNKLFSEYDGFIMPAAGSVAPLIKDATNKISKSNNEYKTILENHMAIGNFGGYPSITIPSGMYNNMPIGINITSGFKKDVTVISIASKLENLMPYHDMVKEDI